MLEEVENTALKDEITSINSIYGEGTLNVTATNLIVDTVFQVPSTQLAFHFEFPVDYPNHCPNIRGVHSVGCGGAKGTGVTAEEILRRSLDTVWKQGQECLFDLIEEASPRLGQCEDSEDGGVDNDVSDEDHDLRRSTEYISQPSVDMAIWAALIRTHHITSRKKVVTLKAAAKNFDCSALLRSGGTPGVMYCEGREDSVQKWVDSVHNLRYKDYQLVAPPGPAPGEALRVEPRGFAFEEVATVKQFGAKMEEKGLTEWWREAMGYARVAQDGIRKLGR